MEKKLTEDLWLMNLTNWLNLQNNNNEPKIATALEGKNKYIGKFNKRSLAR